MPSFAFWHKWLLVVGIANIGIGLVIALAPGSFLFAPHTEAIADVFFEGHLTEAAEELRTFLFGILGGTLAGYFFLQTLIVWIPFRKRQRWAWHAVAWVLLLWFVVDSSLSIYHGALFNVWMINVWALLLIGVPLMMTYTEFRASSELD